MMNPMPRAAMMLTGLLGAVGTACGAQIFVDDNGSAGGAPQTAAQSTSSAQGANSRTAVSGGAAGAPCVEELCDGADNDCDGAVDESDPNIGLGCPTGLPGICLEGAFECVTGALACVQLQVPEPEECDGIDSDCDGAPDNGACSKVVFATSQLLQANLGGLAGADAICQSHAAAANLPGVFKAWLSDSSTSASQRLTHNDGPYRLVDETVVALDWNDLVDGWLQHPIDRAEYGSTPPMGTACTSSFDFFGGPVWTNTNSQGGAFQAADSCSNWTSATDSPGAVGDFGRAEHWSLYCHGGNMCAFTAVLYCFEQ